MFHKIRPGEQRTRESNLSTWYLHNKFKPPPHPLNAIYFYEIEYKRVDNTATAGFD